MKPLNKPNIRNINFNETPFLVIWETTRSCALRCVHCRAESINERHPEELSKDQAFKLLDEVKSFQSNPSGPTPLVVLTGGDPMRRPDILDIVEYGTRIGLRMTMTPSGTYEMTEDIVSRLKNAGLARLAVSLDGSNAKVHDSFRSVEGSFRWTLDIVRWANKINLPVQINTTITRHNLNDFDALCVFLKKLEIVMWSVFFLVPTGRGKLEDEVSASQYEKIFNKMADFSRDVPFDVKTTEAMHFRRVVIQRKKDLNQTERGVDGPGFFTKDPNALKDSIFRSERGVNAGNGFVFVSHLGDIYPSGFLPIKAGNVKDDSLIQAYRHSELFNNLRDVTKIKGKCGVCEYRFLCGGSRSRAYGVTGDYLAQDPFCVYVPKGYKVTEEDKRYWF